MNNQRFTKILLCVALLLLIPLVAMQLTDEVNWSVGDFVIAGILLLSTGWVGDLIIQKISTTKLRFALLFFLFIAFLLVWAELAVGVFGTPFSGN